VTLRFFDTNTTVNLKCLEFLKALFQMLVLDNYRMSEYEANAFLPYLVNKVGREGGREGGKVWGKGKQGTKCLCTCVGGGV
jgi:hypothetical protein